MDDDRRMDANSRVKPRRCRARATAAAVVGVMFALLSCGASAVAAGGGESPRADRGRGYKVVHVFVALCDNEHQGIAPVPAKLGDGRDPANNLYWGAMYGVKTFFRRSPDWKTVAVAERSK